MNVIETLKNCRKNIKVQEELFAQSMEMAKFDKPSLSEKADGAAYALHRAGELFDEAIENLSERESVTANDVLDVLSPIEKKLDKLHDIWSHFVGKTSEKSLFNIMGGTVFGFDLALGMVRNIFFEIKNAFDCDVAGIAEAV